MRVFLQDGTVVDAGAEEWVILELSDRDKLNIQAMNVSNGFFAVFPAGLKGGAMQDILEDVIQTAQLRDRGITLTEGEPAKEGDNPDDKDSDDPPAKPVNSGEMTDENGDKEPANEPDPDDDESFGMER